jgi:hemolysin activation/secretion protein
MSSWVWGTLWRRETRAVLVLAFLGLLAAPLNAQTIAPSQVTPEDLRPVRTPSGSVTIPAAAGLRPPAGAEGMFISLRGAVIEGGFAELSAANAGFSAELSGKRLSLAAIFAAASRLERAYAAEGYVLVRLVVPPQKLDNGGTLRVRVIDGYIEDVQMKGVAPSQQALVRSRVADLIGRKRMTQGEMERRLLLITELPGLKARSTLAPGKEGEGGTLIVLEATHDPVSGSVGGDNRSSQAMGGGSLSYSLSANSIWGMGEQFYVMASSGPELQRAFRNTSPLSMVGGGVSIPLGVNGFTLNVEGVHSLTRPTPAPFSPRSVGTMDRIEVRALYPLIKTQMQTLSVQGSYLWLQQGLEAVDFGQQLYMDRYSVARLQLDHRVTFGSGSMVNTVLTYSRGLSGRGQGEAAATGVGLSTSGGRPVFDKAVLVLRASTPLPYQSQLSLTARGQSSFNRPMLTGESLALDGSDAVSGLTPGSLSADQGATLRAELTHTLPLTTLAGVRVASLPYVFGAVGVGFLTQPSPVQQARTTATTFGAGIRFNTALASTNLGTSLALEYARSHSTADGRVTNRINLSSSLRF